MAFRRTSAAPRSVAPFVVVGEGFPVNVLNTLNQVSEVCSIFCATADPVELVVAETELGRGILGVVDGAPPVGVEAVDAQPREPSAWPASCAALGEADLEVSRAEDRSSAR